MSKFCGLEWWLSCNILELLLWWPGWKHIFTHNAARWDLACKIVRSQKFRSLSVHYLLLGRECGVSCTCVISFETVGNYQIHSIAVCVYFSQCMRLWLGQNRRISTICITSIQIADFDWQNGKPNPDRQWCGWGQKGSLCFTLVSSGEIVSDSEWHIAISLSPDSQKN